MAKFVTAEQAVAIVKDGDTVSVNGCMFSCNPDALCQAIAKRFRETRSPKGLTLWGATSLGGGIPGMYIDAFAYKVPGLVGKAIMGQFSSCPSIADAVAENAFPAYNLPQGVISQLYRAAGCRQPYVYSKVGLKTFVDPRLQGAALNAKAAEIKGIVNLVEIDGDEYLQYSPPKLDVVFLCGSISDLKGNISMENEASYVDAITLALAAKANGGIVMVQVKEVSNGRINSKDVKIPCEMVDYVVVEPKQRQMVLEEYNPAVAGKDIMPEDKILAYIERVMKLMPSGERSPHHFIAARRAYLEIQKGDVVNLGIGMPGLISNVAAENGTMNDFTMTTEVGIFGGSPLPQPGFGTTLNPTAIIDMPYIFDYYDGGNLDGVYVGAAQINAKGDVNVSKVGKRTIGVGGFINLTQGSHKVVFITTFQGGKQLKTVFVNGKLNIVTDGSFAKFVEQPEQISFSGDFALKQGQDITYVTERCVFKLMPGGLTLTEIAPGIDLQKDILNQMEFEPLISKDLKEMDSFCFKG